MISELRKHPLGLSLLIPYQRCVLLIMSFRSWHHGLYPTTSYSCYVSTRISSSPVRPQPISTATSPAQPFTPLCKRTSMLMMASAVYLRHVSTVPVQATLKMAATVSNTLLWNYFRPRVYNTLTRLLLVTAYTGSNATAWCSDNAISIPVGICTPMSIGSYSVDCPGINGTYDPGYTTILASNKSSLPVTTSTPTYNPTTVSPTSMPLSSLSSSLPQTRISPSQDIGSSSSSASQPSSSPSNSTTSSQGREGSGNDGGLSGPSTIAIGVVLPGVAVIVAIVFGILGVKKYRREGRVLPRRRWSL